MFGKCSEFEFLSHCLKYSVVRPIVGPWHQSWSTNQPSTYIAHNVAIQVGHNHHIELLGPGNQLTNRQNRFTASCDTTGCLSLLSVKRPEHPRGVVHHTALNWVQDKGGTCTDMPAWWCCPRSCCRTGFPGNH